MANAIYLESFQSVSLLTVAVCRLSVLCFVFVVTCDTGAVLTTTDDDPSKTSTAMPLDMAYLPAERE